MAKKADFILSFVDSSDAIIYLKDEEGRFLMGNRKAAEFAGLSEEEFIGKTDYDIVPKEEAERFRALDRQVIDTGAPVNYTGEVTTRSGKVRVFDHKFPVSVEGHPKAVGGVAIQIKE